MTKYDHWTPDQRNALTRYLSILSTVSSRKAASAPTTTTQVANGLIDKLECRILPALSAEHVRFSSLFLDWKCELTHLRDRNQYLWAHCTKRPKKGFYFRMKYGTDSLTHLTSNPSYFTSSLEYCESLKTLLGAVNLADVKITRMDFTVDYEIPYAKFIQNCDVIGKQSKENYKDAGKEINAMYFGKNPARIVIYDKSRARKSNDHVSRVEAQLKGKQLPFRSISDLEDSNAFIQRLKAKNPLKNVSVFDLSFTALPKLNPRLQRFQSLVEAIGFNGAKHQCNEHRNFEREIGPLIRREMLTPQPGEALIQGLEAFFGGS